MDSLPPSEKKSSSQEIAMAVEAIKSLKIKKGASKETINKYYEENHGMDKEYVEGYVSEFLRNGRAASVLEKVGEERFKVKKMKKAAKQLLEGKKSSSHQVAKMVVDAMKSSNMKKGAPKGDMNKYLKGNRGMNKEYVERNVSAFLKTGCVEGILKEVGKEQFKAKTMEKAKTEKMNGKKVLSESKEKSKTSSQ